MADPETSVAVAAVQALTEVLRHSEASTMMEVQKELKLASSQLVETQHNSCSQSQVTSITSGCELFTRFVTRAFLDIPNFEECKRVLIQRSERFKDMTVGSRLRIAYHAEPFITDGSTILVHGLSRVVSGILCRAAKLNKRFKVLVTESRPDDAGIAMLKRLHEAGVPGTFISDSAVAYHMSEIDMVIVGAEAVVESGGVINKIGTYQISIVAFAFNIPFYVAAESYKFSRIYPLGQKDLPSSHSDDHPLRTQFPDSTELWNPVSDYTPPKYIRLLFTDLGVLTPSAVSDELIKLYT